MGVECEVRWLGVGAGLESFTEGEEQAQSFLENVATEKRGW